MGPRARARRRRAGQVHGVGRQAGAGADADAVVGGGQVQARSVGGDDLLVPEAVALHGLLVEQGLDADAAGLGAEMAAEGVGAGEAAAAAPGAAGAEVAAADEFLLAAVEALVAFAVVLAREGLAADGADEGPFVGVGAQVGAEVVGAREAFGAEVALEVGRVFLHPSGVVGLIVVGPGGIGEVEEVFTFGVDGGCGGTPHPGGWGGAAGAGLIRAVERREGPVAVV
ncbi:MAG: hypothetical protein LQ347_003509 [Umbilicaria vellea]|nr:MAG: hypothetical protein LQ347_003509 [Umbilicaria vellea]